MVKYFSEYASSIVVLIISTTMIELILPNSKNKKYVIFVCSLVITLAVINPILKIFNSKFDITSEVAKIQNEINSLSTNYMASNEFATNEMYNENYSDIYNNAQDDMHYNIKSAYIANLEKDMKTRLEDIGYEILESKLNVDSVTYEPTEIEMKVKYKDGTIRPIVIDVFETSQPPKISEVDSSKIKEILSKNYGVSKNKIKINEIWKDEKNVKSFF